MALAEVAVEEATNFLDLSRGGPASKMLVKQGVKQITTLLTNKIVEMSDDEIRQQILYVRDQIIPMLLGPEQIELDARAMVAKQEADDGIAEDKDKG